MSDEYVKRIYKYPLEVKENQTVMMPNGSKILCCKVQNGVITLWAEFDRPYEDSQIYEDTKFEERIIQVYITGQKIHYRPELCQIKYIDTILTDNDDTVLHICELVW